MKCFLPEQTHVSQVHLRTANLGEALAFYSDVLGLKVSDRPNGQALLSAAEGPGLLVLTEDGTARPHPPRATGLYHFAIRYPNRAALAHAYARLQNKGCPIDGASDHGVSEAIYLNDPDGNGVELYTDRPREQWPSRNGQLSMVTRALPLEELLASAGGESGKPPAQTDIGHIHLHVPELAAAERFYSGFLGLAVTQRSYPGALFFAAGGYHHHIGVNVWGGKSAPPANSVGLVSYRLEVPVPEILYCLGHRAPLLGYETRTQSADESAPILQIRDPNGNWLEVQAASAGPPIA